MSVLDTATGLPQLPEGYRWFVAEEKQSSLYDYYTVKTGRFVIQIERDCSTTKTGVTTRKHWWSRPTKAPDVTTEKWLIDPLCKPKVIKGGDAEAALTAAEKCLAKWEAEKVRTALLGAYPPKTLGVTS